MDLYEPARDNLRLYVADPSGGRVEAELQALTQAGATCFLERVTRFAGAVGDELELSLVFLHLFPRVERPIRARLVHRNEQERRTVLRFEFGGAAMDLLRDPELALAFERRGGIRTPIEGPVTLALPGVALETGALADISTGGLAADLSSEFEAAMVGRDAVECLFRLPGDDTLRSIGARIRHRTLHSDGRVRLGLMFHDDEDGRLQAVREGIVAWIGAVSPRRGPPS